MPKNSSPTALITGIPRSGTTLLTALLNAQHNTVALAEPFPVEQFSSTPQGFVRDTRCHIQRIRHEILEKKTAPSVSQSTTSQSTNFFVPMQKGQQLRPRMGHRRSIRIEKSVDDDFSLYIKHPAAFTAQWEVLSTNFPIFAVIRSPIAVLASWQTVDLPINRGYLPVAERHVPSLRELLKQEPDCLKRQVVILNWFLQIYKRFPSNSIVRYEDLLSNPQRTLRVLHPLAQASNRTFVNLPLNKRYPAADLEKITRALIPLSRVTNFFYPAGDPSGNPPVA